MQKPWLVRGGVLAMLAGALAIALGGCASSSDALAEFAGDIQEVSIPHDGLERSYYLVDGGQPGREAPVVIALHGADTRSVADFFAETGWHEKAVEEGIVVVLPEGTASGRRLQWNALACCGAPAADGVDDVGFVLAVVDDLIRNRAVDPNRIYLTGKSNGAMLTNLVISLHGDRFAAAAGVVGTVFDGAGPVTHPTPILLINMQDDPLIPHDPDAEPGFIARRFLGDTMLGAVRSAEHWAVQNGASEEPERSAVAGGYQARYLASGPGEEVLFVSLSEGGHIWPSGEYNATDEIWAFFERHEQEAD